MVGQLLRKLLCIFSFLVRRGGTIRWRVAVRRWYSHEKISGSKILQVKISEGKAASELSKNFSLPKISSYIMVCGYIVIYAQARSKKLEKGIGLF